MKQICLDAGVIFQYFAKDVPSKVQHIMDGVLSGKYETAVFKAVLVEVFYHLCKQYGKEHANILLVNFTRKFPLRLLDLDEGLILTTGLLKCQHRTRLSYIDCMSIAHCLNSRIEFHTTEKKLKEIPEHTLKRLKIVKYSF